MLFYFLPTYLLIQLPLQSPLTIPSSTTASFYLPLSSPYLLFHLTITTIPTNTPFLCNLAILCFPIFTYSQWSWPKIFSPTSQGFPYWEGAWGHPSNDFFQKGPIKTNAPPMRHPLRKNEAPHLKNNPPHWNMKHPWNDS